MDIKPQDIDRIIEMAWEDRTPFEAIEYQFGLKENGVRKIMRAHLKRGSFELWRKRVKEEKQSTALLLIQQGLNLRIKNNEIF